MPAAGTVLPSGAAAREVTLTAHLHAVEGAFHLMQSRLQEVLAPEDLARWLA